jgi:Tfp pilus assembly protein PilF
MFNEEDPPNYKASGICYSNIGNIQYKNGNFDQAEDNFTKAIEAIKNNLNRIKGKFKCEVKENKKHLSNKQLKKQVEKRLK